MTIFQTALLQVARDKDSDKKLEAQSLIERLDFIFIFCLHLFCDVLHILKILSDYLQKSDYDLVVTITHVEAQVSHFTDLRKS